MFNLKRLTWWHSLWANLLLIDFIKNALSWKFRGHAIFVHAYSVCSFISRWIIEAVLKSFEEFNYAFTSCHFLTNGLCALIADIFWTTISMKEFRKEVILLHIDVDILNGFFDSYYSKKDTCHSSQKQIEINPIPPARNVFSFTLFI